MWNRSLSVTSWYFPLTGLNVESFVIESDLIGIHLLMLDDSSIYPYVTGPVPSGLCNKQF